MPVWPVVRSWLMAKLLRAAVFCGPRPVWMVAESSWKTVSRTPEFRSGGRGVVVPS